MPAVCPTSEMSGFSRDDTERSNAAGLQSIPPVVTRISVGHVRFASWLRPLPTSNFKLNKVKLVYSVTKMVVSCYESLPLLQVRAW